jgi:hypothetical protein
VGVDTHKDLHVARVKDELGRGLGEITIPASVRVCHRENRISPNRVRR